MDLQKQICPVWTEHLNMAQLYYSITKLFWETMTE